MSDEKVLNILKSAILLEKRGYAFYEQVAKQAQDQEVKDFFSHMAQEEVEHVNILTSQYKSYNEYKKFTKENLPDYQITEKVITTSVREKIKAASFEAAAISAAITMEENAIKLYSQRAQASDDENEIKLFNWLANWETQHLSDLQKIDKELQESIWYDNQFWPM